MTPVFRSLLAAGFLLAMAYGNAAEVEVVFASNDGLSTEAQCFADNVYAATKDERSFDVTADDDSDAKEAKARAEEEYIRKTAWALKNRVESSEYPSTHCAMVPEEFQAPWQEIEAGATAHELIRYNTIEGRRTDQYKDAAKELGDYQLEVRKYNLAQIAAWGILNSWDTQDPSSGGTRLPGEVVVVDES